MSEVYCLEPPCRGRVILHTSEGELDIRLWSSQCPKAVRNFVQLCLEGYYNNCIFHRIIPQFMVQTGDPSGTGHGGESIYGEPFENEIMSRLKFRYRGLVGMANTGGKHSNGSQFFITLERADCLNGKYTLFGKVEGATVYNLMKIGQAEVNPANDRPTHPPRIIRVEVLANPFPDIQPRLLALHEQQGDEEDEQPAEKEVVSVRKACLLSFGGAGDSDDEGAVPVRIGKKAKSAHELLQDPKLSKQSVVLRDVERAGAAEPATARDAPEEGHDESADEQSQSSGDEADDRRREIEMLQSQLRSKKRGAETALKGHDGASYMTRKQMKLSGAKPNVMERFAAFTKRLGKLTKDSALAAKAQQETDEDLADGSWFAGRKLQFSVDSVKAYEVDAAKDTLTVFDPLQGKDNSLGRLSALRKDGTKGHPGGGSRDRRER
ncbi:peptidyl-prolyl cis-trans isomerase, cyclophilin-type family protein, putative [Babesia bigemina]|uniref:Peptidyl-prolyl cis-trans isomerase, cyclophilin-type family protein, putative n=1 Tax=Babesia bigemina TaxID=5866 RepID=A0A061D528_BABBI|nr:peptidyl-prolyl cis-trans isomerase, cyclophilin-type family protein, putative [Babesia bigemina]CDR94069.1 peptidyl-prolyl cis-trans isomerase, cyclophilin-type family protein, putative [Babesia bigemina]|eukprot:XP_012766255.1 peptidyl-prolyl cis-trans isomerase, cyclophilin-type family protein, putative [Babesia bigemina]